jgi:hypothetical protein
MNENKLNTIEKLINDKKIEQAQIELSKLGEKFLKNSEYLYLRGKIFYIKKLYYLALDTLLIALEFEEKDKIYKINAKNYNILTNKKQIQKLLQSNLRLKTKNTLKNPLSGI